MTVALYGGQAIFGPSHRVVGTQANRAGDLTSYFGADDLGWLDGGGRGGVSLAVGLLAGYGPSGLGLAEGQFRSFNDGRARDLLDTLGVVWTQVLCERFAPTGRVLQSPAGVWFRGYRAQFRHLV